MRDELGVLPTGQGAFDPGEDHRQRIVLGYPAHRLGKGLRGSVLANTLGVSGPESGEAPRHIDPSQPLTRG